MEIKNRYLVVGGAALAIAAAASRSPPRPAGSAGATALDADRARGRQGNSCCACDHARRHRELGRARFQVPRTRSR